MVARVVSGDPRPLTARQQRQLTDLLTLCRSRTGLLFTVYLGALAEPTRDHAWQLHQRLGAEAADAVLLAVSPGQRLLEITTGVRAAARIPDRTCALAALSATASFAVGDLLGGVRNGVRMLADQAGAPPR